jgi:hypothetical protein
VQCDSHKCESSVSGRAGVEINLPDVHAELAEQVRIRRRVGPQKLGQLQHFRAVFPLSMKCQECVGQLASFAPTRSKVLSRSLWSTPS